MTDRLTTYTARLYRAEGGHVTDIRTEFATEQEAIDNARALADTKYPTAGQVGIFAKTTHNGTLLAYPKVLSLSLETGLGYRP